MIKRAAIIAALVLSGALSLACSSGKESGEFLKKAAQGGMTEVQLGKLAGERASASAVKQFGQRMIDDHTKANNELKSIAAQKNVTLPQEVNSDQKSETEKLQKLSGADFDKEYIQYMVKDHEEDVEEFQKQASGGTDAEVKAFAAKTLPVLQGHLQMARDVARSVGAK